MNSPISRFVRSSRPLMRSVAPPFALIFLSACGSPGPSPAAPAPRASAVAPPPASASPPKESPPTIGALPPFSLPHVTRDTLSNGLHLSLITRPSAPLVESRVLVRDATQVIDIGTAHVLAAYLNENIGRSGIAPETVGARLSIEARGESIQLSLTAPKKGFREALGIAAPLVASPKWDGALFARVKSRLNDSAQARAKTDGQTSVATAALHTFGFAGRKPSASDVSAVTLEKVKELHQKAFVKKNVSIVVVGNVELDEAKAMIDRSFSALSTRPAPILSTKALVAPSETRVLLIDRPKSAQSSVLVAMLAPPMNKENGVAAELFTSCLGDSNALSNRLFSDVREKRGLAYVIGSDILNLGRDARPWFTYAATQTAKTGETVAALLETIRGLPSLRADEVESAKQLATANLAAKMETAHDLADLVTLSERFALADNHWDELSKAIARANASSLLETFRSLDVAHPLIVVNGDAEAVTTMLRPFGPVSLLDPLDFHLIRTEQKGSQ